MKFEWDENKNTANVEKHCVSFETAQKVFLDPRRVIARDVKHSTESEARYFCFGMCAGVIITVRFTVRNDIIRIIGAGIWREGKRKYDEKNKVR